MTASARERRVQGATTSGIQGMYGFGEGLERKGLGLLLERSLHARTGIIAGEDEERG
jgi:hypothetical protein